MFSSKRTSAEKTIVASCHRKIEHDLRALPPRFQQFDEARGGLHALAPRLPQRIEGAAKECLVVRHHHVGPNQVSKLLVVGLLVTVVSFPSLCPFLP
jgi:hypothetical protein